MSEEKIKIKAGHHFDMSEDSLTVKYSESGLRVPVIHETEKQ